MGSDAHKTGHVSHGPTFYNCRNGKRHQLNYPPGCHACIINKLLALLSECRGDIFQTARTNQTNLTGLDIITPEDPPIPARIDNCKVNQRGIDESLELVKRIEKTMREVDPDPARRTA